MRGGRGGQVKHRRVGQTAEDEDEAPTVSLAAHTSPNRDHELPYELWAAAVGGLGGLAFGYDIGVISGALVSLTEDFDLSADAEGLVVSMLALGQLPGSILGGLMTDGFGRKRSIHCQNCCYLLGSVVTATADDLAALLVGQFIVGVGVAISVASNLSYVTELVSRDKVGGLVSFYELCTAGGVFLAYLVYLVLSKDEHAWRRMFFCGVSFPVLQSLAILQMPESPKWLHAQGRRNDALTVLRLLHNNDADAAARALANMDSEEGATVEEDARVGVAGDGPVNGTAGHLRSLELVDMTGCDKADPDAQRPPEEPPTMPLGSPGVPGGRPGLDTKRGMSALGVVLPPRLQIPPPTPAPMSSPSSTAGDEDELPPLPPSPTTPPESPSNWDVVDINDSESEAESDGRASSERLRRPSDSSSAADGSPAATPFPSRLFRHDRHTHRDRATQSQPPSRGSAQQAADSVATTVRHWRAPLMVMAGLIVFGFFTGGINVRIYAPTIFKEAGMGRTQRAIMTVVLGCVKVLATLLAVLKIDEFGRRSFFLAGVSLMASGALLLMLATTCLQAGALSPGPAQALVVVACLAYTIAYQVSFGPGIFVVGSEIFPARIRGRLLGAQTFLGSVCLAITSELFPALVARIGLAGTFACHLACCVACLAFLFFFLAETKAASPETTRQRLEERIFGRAWPCRCAGGGGDGRGGGGRRAFDRCPEMDASDSAGGVHNVLSAPGHDVQMV